MAKQELELLVNLARDPVAQENFDRIREFISGDLFTKFDGAFVELTIPSATANYKFAHNLGFIPKDIILLNKSGSGTITFNYDLFDSDNLDITTTAGSTIRFIAGQFVTNR